MLPSLPTPGQLSDAAANVFDKVARGGLADLRPTPARIIHESPQCTVFRYLRPDDDGTVPERPPVLLVPPLAAPALCFDLRRGHSLAGHLLAAGHPVYLVEYGPIAFSDRVLGLEHWVEDVIPTAVRHVSADCDGAEVQVAGWCLGGIMSVLSVAGDPSLPVRSLACVASPFDFTQVRLVAPLRPIANLTNGAIITQLYRALGGAPSPLVRRAFQLTSIDKELTKPLVMLLRLHDRDFLAQLEAVDRFMASMHAYPGRTFGQLYHQFFRVNDLADGRLRLSDQDIDLADVRVPVLSVAGETDVLAPRAAVHHLGTLLPNAPEVRLETGPGGHLGVLAGRGARTTTWRWLDEFLCAHAGADADADTESAGSIAA
ncbi:MAG TPA: alpha/beta hydrolase [Solirubrobacteraceae bacterium]|nr:alpha/beta hydrolase [Solirubrobacteraceae bacterium]